VFLRQDPSERVYAPRFGPAKSRGTGGVEIIHVGSSLLTPHRLTRGARMTGRPRVPAPHGPKALQQQVVRGGRFNTATESKPISSNSPEFGQTLRAPADRRPLTAYIAIASTTLNATRPGDCSRSSVNGLSGIRAVPGWQVHDRVPDGFDESGVNQARAVITHRVGPHPGA